MDGKQLKLNLPKDKVIDFSKLKLELILEKPSAPNPKPKPKGRNLYKKQMGQLRRLLR